MTPISVVSATAASGVEGLLARRRLSLRSETTTEGKPILAVGRRSENGDVAQGTSLIRDGLAAHRAIGAEARVPHYFALLAKAFVIAGQMGEAVVLRDDALQIGDRTGERWPAVELNRHKGQLLLRQGHSEAADALYRKSLGIAREQEAKLWELRAAASIVRLWSEQGRRARAARTRLQLVHRGLRDH
jgi:predicted ATPase